MLWQLMGLCPYFFKVNTIQHQGSQIVLFIHFLMPTIQKALDEHLIVLWTNFDFKEMYFRWPLIHAKEPWIHAIEQILKHTCKHKWSLQPFSQDYDLVSHTTYVLCVNFIQFLDKLFMEILFTRPVFARNQLRGNRRRNFLYLVLISDLGFKPWPYV